MIWNCSSNKLSEYVHNYKVVVWKIFFFNLNLILPEYRRECCQGGIFISCVQSGLGGRGTIFVAWGGTWDYCSDFSVNINTINDHAEPAAPAVSAAAARTIPKNQGRKNPPNAPPPLWTIYCDLTCEGCMWAQQVRRGIGVIRPRNYDLKTLKQKSLEIKRVIQFHVVFRDACNKT